jgi:cell division protein FtsL
MFPAQNPAGKESPMKLKKAGIITKIAIFAMIVYAAVTLVRMQAQIETALAELEVSRQQVTEKETTNAELRYAIEHSDDPDIIAEAARKDLGYVAPGEKVFYDTGN